MRLAKPTIGTKTDTTLEVKYNTLTTQQEKGGKIDVTYEVQVRPISEWIDSGSGPEGSSSIEVKNLEPVTKYFVRVRACNAFGCTLEYSPCIHTYTDGPPDQIEKPTLTVVGDKVKIDWIAPPDNGEVIMEYNIRFRSSKGTYVESPTCDGTDAKIIKDASCTIPMSEFTKDPFNLADGDNIYARIHASNVYGTGRNTMYMTSGMVKVVAPKEVVKSYDRTASTHSSPVANDVTTQVVGTNLVVSFSPDGKGSQIRDAKVQVANFMGNFVLHTPKDVVFSKSESKIEFPLHVLGEQPYLLPFDEKIMVRVKL